MCQQILTLFLLSRVYTKGMFKQIQTNLTGLFKRWVDGVEKFKVEKSERSIAQPWRVREPAPEKRFLQDPSPRLVGGTSFDPNLALDQHQVLTLAEASLQSMEDARKVVRAWHRQGQSLADIYLLGLTPAARLLG